MVYLIIGKTCHFQLLPLSKFDFVSKKMLSSLSFMRVVCFCMSFRLNQCSAAVLVGFKNITLSLINFIAIVFISLWGSINPCSNF